MLLDGLAEPVALVGHPLGGCLAPEAAIARADADQVLVLEDRPKPPRDGPFPDELVAHTERLLDPVTADPAGEIARMLRETTWAGKSSRRGPRARLSSTVRSSSRATGLAPPCDEPVPARSGGRDPRPWRAR